ncbi:DUF5711 family protein [Dysosmobacter sp.]|uniref:DUF5711 family protein n=1 Tax=Dysosmobacter sp. TaxID=2591382 RepID=UPI002A842605|nr:DUF5711 family protein [Dysosmobacter sp.]MDY3985608.1 DUF5711 family protein [Dysosmobacter sp.]
MADTTKDIWNDNDGEEERKPRRGRGLRRFLIFFLTLAAVLGIVLLAAYRDGTGFDVLRRYFSYGSTQKAYETVSYTYDAASSNRFAALGDSLVVLSDTSLRVLDGSGKDLWSTAVRMESPALVSGGGRAVAYDVGGTALYVLDSSGLVEDLTDKEAEPIISARLNGDGWLAVTAEKKNYKGAVSVYNKKLELVFGFHSSQRFLMDAWVTDDGKYLAAVALGQESGTFVSNVVLYDLTQTDPAADYDVSDGLVLAIGQQGDAIVTVADSCLHLADTAGEERGSYRYDGAYLREFSMTGQDYTVLLLNRYQSGSVGRLVTVGTDGGEIASLDVNEEVLSVSAEGRYIAVLYLDRLVVYNRDLQVYASLNGTGYAREALMRPDGSVLLLGSESAKLFLP